MAGWLASGPKLSDAWRRAFCKYKVREVGELGSRRSTDRVLGGLCYWWPLMGTVI